ncbi:hypothetical protein RJ639_031804 [Escallonia herrerae]|uniref:Reverse transcriptase Ty1/copia-type domain-containing protein n=1 Tax=Escallonia herrerae TaxID=1293975 RepID=A0AA88X6R5_9ASTE|nr:hypothetical protein RJ639_031804 [Escallonia herrerae]
MGHSRVTALYGPSGTENWILLDWKILNHKRGLDYEIEEDNRQSEKKADNYHQEAKANMVEQELHKNGVLYKEPIWTKNPHKRKMNLDVARELERLHLLVLIFLTYLLENEPHTYSEAMSSPEAPHWKAAIDSKIESIMQNHMWELVIRITSIRILMTITTINNLDIHQMDVKTAFLNGDLNEEIYMEQPEGICSS